MSDRETTGSHNLRPRRIRRGDAMAELTTEERHEAWCGSVDGHLDRLSADVAGLSSSVGEISTIKRLTAGILPTMVIAALGFVVTAYVAFDRLGRAQNDLDGHTHAAAIQAHPDIVTTVAPVRETQERILATVEAMQREAGRRDQEIQARLDRMETRLDTVRTGR